MTLLEKSINDQLQDQSWSEDRATLKTEVPVGFLPGFVAVLGVVGVLQAAYNKGADAGG